MPTYEYKCVNCDYKFEKFQSMTASALRKCPKCGKAAMKRLIGTGAGVIFKGSGFYETDYRSESYKNAAQKETGSEKTEKKETKAGSVASTLRQSSVQAGSPQGEKKPAKSKNESKSG